jgi:DNA polymerase-3 subunit delta
MNLSPIYVLLGEENFLKETALSKIKKQCFPPENEASIPFNSLSIEGKTITPSQIISECHQLPFMNNTRLVIVKDAEKLINNEEILEYIKNPVKTTCLVLLMQKIDKRLTAYKALKENSNMQEFDHPEEKDLLDWIQHYIKTQKKKISASDSAYLTNILDSNLTGINQELEKLITYTGNNETITLKDIQTIVSENKLDDNFALTKAIQNKDTSNAIRLINKQLDDGDPIQQIMGSIRWMLTRLWQGKELLQKGDRYSLSKELRISPYFLNEFINQAEKFTISELKKGLIKIFELEKLIRTYSLPENLVLELLIIQLTKKSTHLN